MKICIIDYLVAEIFLNSLGIWRGHDAYKYLRLYSFLMFSHSFFRTILDVVLKMKQIGATVVK